MKGLGTMSNPTRIVPVILSGGAGTRLWPSSRVTYPKQFLPLLGSKSTFEERSAASAIVRSSPIPSSSRARTSAFSSPTADPRRRQRAHHPEPMRRDSGPASRSPPSSSAPGTRMR